jgi:hypothetical protein
MSAVEWQIGVPTGKSLATHRGIRVVVKLSQTGSPIEIAWFIEGRLAESSSVDYDLAKKVGSDAVDQRDELWLQAEKKDREFHLMKRRVE